MPASYQFLSANARFCEKELWKEILFVSAEEGGNHLDHVKATKDAACKQRPYASTFFTASRPIPETDFPGDRATHRKSNAPW